MQMVPAIICTMITRSRKRFKASATVYQPLEWAKKQCSWQASGGSRASVREGLESRVFHDHCDDHDDEDDVEPRDDDVRDGLDDLSLHRGSESVEPREGLC